MKRGGCEGLWVRGNEYVSLISLQIHTWDDSNDEGVWWPLLSSVAHCFPSWRKMSDQCLFENYLNKECLVPLLLFFSLSLNLCSFPLQRGSLNYSFGGYASNIIYVHFTNLKKIKGNVNLPTSHEKNVQYPCFCVSFSHVQQFRYWLMLWLWLQLSFLCAHTVEVALLKEQNYDLKHAD